MKKWWFVDWNQGWTRWVLIVIGLTVLFIIDDVLILVLIDELRIWVIPPFIYFIISTIALGLNFWLAIVVYRVLRKKPTTGMEGMIGQMGTAIERLDQTGRISVKGEIWYAESSSRLSKGDKVEITGVSGLVLLVKPIH